MRDTPRLDIPVVTKISVIVFVLFGGFVMYQLLLRSDQPEHNGDPIDLRGTNIIVLRMPDSLAPSQRIAFYEDGSVIRFFVPYNAATSQKTQLMLRADEQWDVQAFRAQWCATPQQVIQPKTGYPSYDIAVRCDDPHIKQAVVEVEQLPTILRDILQHLPALPQEQQNRRIRDTTAVNQQPDQVYAKRRDSCIVSVRANTPLQPTAARARSFGF
jgi:hypothetical protein